MISQSATSEELSSPNFATFFRTIPPDGGIAKAMVDIIEYYGWKYIAAVAVDLHTDGMVCVLWNGRRMTGRRSVLLFQST